MIPVDKEKIKVKLALVIPTGAPIAVVNEIIDTYKNIKANIFWVQANNSIMCGYFCIRFIDFMLAGKTLIDYTNLFSPYDFNKNDQIILSYFKDAWNR